MKKKSNIVKLPFVKKEIIYRRNKPEKIIKGSLTQGFVEIVVVGLTHQGELKVRSSCGKICQSMAMLDIAKSAYMENYHSKQIITGKCIIE